MMGGGIRQSQVHLDSSTGPLGGKNATAAFVERGPTAVWRSMESTTWGLEDPGSFAKNVIRQWKHHDFGTNGELQLEM